VKLPIFRQMAYISPSSFLTWRKCQYKIYLEKQSGFSYPQQKPTIHAQVGIAFDAFVKDFLARKHNIKSPILHLDRMLVNCQPDEINLGKELAKKYVQSKIFQPLLNASEIYLEQETHRVIGGIPLLGRIDIIADGQVLDLKVRGYKAKTKTSPTSGYCSKWVWHNEPYNKWIDQGTNLVSGLLEKAREEWAVQALFYNWIICQSPMQSWVHEIVIQDTDACLAEHKGEFSDKFIETIRKELEEMWDQLTDHFYFSNIDEPRPAVSVCEAYSSLCDVANLCKYYKETLGNPERRTMYV